MARSRRRGASRSRNQRQKTKGSGSGPERITAVRDTAAKNRAGNGLGAGARVIGILTSPVRTLEDVIRRPRVLGTAVTLLAINVLLTVALWERIGAHARWRVEHAPPAGVAPEDLSLLVEQAPVLAAAEALGGPVVTWLMIALLLRIIASGTGRVYTFALLLNVVVFAMLPYMLGLYLESLLKFAVDPERLDFMTLKLSLAHLVPGSQYSGAFPLLNALQPFTIWGLVLVSVGGAKLLDVPLARVAVPLLGLWLLLAVLQVFTYTGPGL